MGKEINNLKKSLEKDKNNYEQEELGSNIIIKGVPVAGNEDLNGIVNQISNKLGFKLGVFNVTGLVNQVLIGDQSK